MIYPSQQWCHQICITSMCWPKTKDGTLTQCSNCTRMLGHEKKRYFMSLDQFETVLKVATPFLSQSIPCPKGRKKVLGIFGGEPLMHHQFPDFVDLMCKYVPVKNRGLWTSVDWTKYENPVYGKAEQHVLRLLEQPAGAVEDSYPYGYLNWNMHDKVVVHQPLLVSISDKISDENKKWDLIKNCWVQQEWSAAYALDHNNEVKFYFCEVASAFDRVFQLGMGLPVEKDVWNHPLKFVGNQPTGVYAKQILTACTRCGAAIPQVGRRDFEQVDDITESNLQELANTSPMIQRGDFVVNGRLQSEDLDKWDPKKYIKG